MRTVVRPHFTALAVVLALTAAAPAGAALSASNSRLQYQIGGAAAVTRPANAQVTVIPLGGSLDLGLGYSCGKFDPLLALTNTLESVEKGAERGFSAMVAAAEGAIASLPALILQRANAGLYDLFQNALLRGEAAISLATKNCQQIEGELARGMNPLENWVRLSKSYDWKALMGSGNGLGSSSTDILTAQDKVDADNGRNGIPWIGGGRAGGAGQPAVRISDVVRAGYNIELNREPRDTSPAPTGTDTRVTELWSAPGAATAYMARVLGDVEISTAEGMPRNATPGHGLSPAIAEDRTTYREVMQQLVAGTLDLSEENLARASPPDTPLTREVIDAIRQLPTAQDRAVLIEKLAGEAAVATNLERALMLRRLLLTGQLEPNVYASPAGMDVQRITAILDREIDQLEMETRIRRELYASSALALLDQFRAQANQGGATVEPPPKDRATPEGGGVSKP